MIRVIYIIKNDDLLIGCRLHDDYSNSYVDMNFSKDNCIKQSNDFNIKEIEGCIVDREAIVIPQGLIDKVAVYNTQTNTLQRGNSLTIINTKPLKSGVKMLTVVNYTGEVVQFPESFLIQCIGNKTHSLTNGKVVTRGETTFIALLNSSKANDIIGNKSAISTKNSENNSYVSILASAKKIFTRLKGDFCNTRELLLDAVFDESDPSSFKFEVGRVVGDVTLLVAFYSEKTKEGYSIHYEGRMCLYGESLEEELPIHRYLIYNNDGLDSSTGIVLGTSNTNEVYNKIIGGLRGLTYLIEAGIEATKYGDMVYIGTYKDKLSDLMGGLGARCILNYDNISNINQTLLSDRNKV